MRRIPPQQRGRGSLWEKDQQQQPGDSRSDEPPASTSAAGAGAVVPWQGGAAGGRATNRQRLARGQEVVATRQPGARSKQGTLGQPIVLRSNYFRLERSDEHAIFQYSVALEPPVEDVGLRHAIVRSQGPAFGSPYIFDGSQFFLYNKLRSAELELPVRAPHTGALHKLTLRYLGAITMASETALQLLNLLQRQAVRGLRLMQLGHHFYDPDAKLSIPKHALEVYPGYITSIRQHEHGLLLSVQTTHRVLRTETVHRLYQLIRARSDKARGQAEFKKAVVGAIVMTAYNHRTYCVTDVDFDTTPESTFRRADGSSVTFRDYFYQTYNVRIGDPCQPMLVTQPSRRQQRSGITWPLLLVPELCRMTGISEEMRRDHAMMRDIAEHTRLGADQRIRRLEAFGARLADTPASSGVLAYWRTQLARRLMDVPARVLPPESIYFGPHAAPVPAGPDADWSRAVRGNAQFKAAALSHWYAVCHEEDGQRLAAFVRCLIAMAREIGFPVSEPIVYRAAGQSWAGFADHLHAAVNRDPQLIVCVLPGDRPDRYRAIKKLCCVDRAIPTQVLQARTITPRGAGTGALRNVATKVAIQLNCKLGGIPWMVRNPLSSVLVVGFDVCHDVRAADRSYGALVATMYGERGAHEPRFFSCVEPHVSGVELSSFLATGIAKALRAYQHDFGGGALPRRILLYRDGVSDGQLGHVVRHEVSAIRERLQASAPGQIRLTVIVVTKRIAARFFLGAGNPPPGTVVDDVVTLPERTDFYLVSQSVRHGTVSPTSYNIVYDESGLTVDQLQAYTAKQAHLYYNWSGAVSVPAVCQYAHKLAALVSQCLRQAPNARLDRSLYFL